MKRSLENSDYSFKSMISDDEVVISFTKESSFIEPFHWILNIAAQEESTLQKNYSSMFDHDNHLLFSLVFQRGVPVMFSTLYKRSFYGDGARCLTRTWKSKSLRYPNMSITFSKRLELMLKHQVDYAETHIEGLKYLFISHQKEHPRLVKYWAKKASLITNRSWEALEQRYLVAPNPKDEACWQWLCLTRFDDFYGVPFIPRESSFLN